MEQQSVVKVELVKPFYKRWWVWIGGIFGLLILISSLGGGGNAPAPSQNQPAQTPETAVGVPTPPPAAPSTWHVVKSWSGTGAKKTEPFTISGKQWRINWSNKDTSGIGSALLQVMVYRPGGSLPLEIPVNTTQEGSDTSYVYQSGEFYLQINPMGSWKITVEELR